MCEAGQSGVESAQPPPDPVSLDHGLGESLFARLHAIGFDGRGMTRPSYSERENAAHRLFEDTARAHGLESRRDWAGNLFLTLPGADRTLPEIMTGSHADTVPCGGNFDGAAGVVAGLLVLCAWARAGFRPARDATVIVTRAEESVWFPISYLGSRAAFGLLDGSLLDTPRRDDGQTLRQHMLACHADPDACGHAPTLDPERIDCFVELHIEQGPVLLGGDVPVGLVDGICGSTRYRSVTIRGAYAHSGATPRAFRADAVMAGASLIKALEQEWAEQEAQGNEMTLTFGVCQTEPGVASFAAVPGRLDLAIDVRSRNLALLEHMNQRIVAEAARVAVAYNVTVDLGPRTQSSPAIMDATLLAQARSLAERTSLPVLTMASGAGHDAATFAGLGVPTLMLFVRNENGSHNPDEAMAFPDFMHATGLLDHLLRLRAAPR
jgi:beta-ureidopropionase / N-carbamoyl-L-amino-acid hydrolase